MKNLVSKKLLVFVALLLLTANSAFAQQRSGKVNLDPTPFKVILSKYYDICSRNLTGKPSQSDIDEMKKIAFNPDNASNLINMGATVILSTKNHAPKNADMSLYGKVGSIYYMSNTKSYQVSYYYYKYQEKLGVPFSRGFRPIKDSNGKIQWKII